MNDLEVVDYILERFEQVKDYKITLQEFICDVLQHRKVLYKHMTLLERWELKSIVPFLYGMSKVKRPIYYSGEREIDTLKGYANVIKESLRGSK